MGAGPLKQLLQPCTKYLERLIGKIESKPAKCYVHLLPAEILLLITESLRDCDILSLRATSRRLHESIGYPAWVPEDDLALFTRYLKYDLAQHGENAIRKSFPNSVGKLWCSACVDCRPLSLFDDVTPSIPAKSRLCISHARSIFLCTNCSCSTADFQELLTLRPTDAPAPHDHGASSSENGEQLCPEHTTVACINYKQQMFHISRVYCSKTHGIYSNVETTCKIRLDVEETQPPFHAASVKKSLRKRSQTVRLCRHMSLDEFTALAVFESLVARLTTNKSTVPVWNCRQYHCDASANFTLTGPSQARILVLEIVWRWGIEDPHCKAYMPQSRHRNDIQQLKVKREVQKGTVFYQNEDVGVTSLCMRDRKGNWMRPNGVVRLEDALGIEESGDMS